MRQSSVLKTINAGILALAASFPGFYGTARAATPPIGRVPDYSGCATCHADAAIRVLSPGERGERMFVSYGALKGTAHEKLACGACHIPLSAELMSHMKDQAAAAFVSCIRCHAREAKDYVAGLHVRNAAPGMKVKAAGTTGSVTATNVSAAAQLPKFGQGEGALGHTCTLCHGTIHVARVATFLTRNDRRALPGLPVGISFAAAGALGALGLLVAFMVVTRKRRHRAVTADGPEEPVPRRKFLKFLGLGAGATVAASVLRPRAAWASGSRTGELAREHAGDAAQLIDVTRCIGCGSCVAACKVVNELAWRDDQPWLGREAVLASANWTAVQELEGQRGADDSQRFLKRQCMHCLEPACVSVCPARALEKERGGPVVYDLTRCIGCRYCLEACPFGVPTFLWDQPISRVSKCVLCFERLEKGLPTACSEACPRQAILFGPREQIVKEAHRRIAAHPDRYVDHVYGEREVGGTSVMYLSDIPFADLGLHQGLPNAPLPDYTWQVSRLLPPIALGLGAVLLALERRREAIALKNGNGEEAETIPRTVDDPNRSEP